MKCPKCGNKTRFKEIIDKGITQEIIYKDGYITEEITKYEKDRGKAICLKCGKEFKKYEL